MPDFKPEAIAPIQFANPVEQYQNMLKAQYLSSEIDKARRVEDENTATNAAFSNWDATKSDDENYSTATNALAKSGVGSAIQKVRQGRATYDKTVAQTGESKAKAAKEQMEKIRLSMGNLQNLYSQVDASDPNVAQQQLYGVFKAEANDKDLMAYINQDPDQHITSRIAELKAAVDQGPDALGQWLTKQSANAKDADAILSQKLQTVNGGDHNDLYDKYGNLIKTTPKKMADHSTHITVNANQKAANAFGEQLGKHEADSYSTLEELSRNAPDTISELDRMVGLVSSGKVYTGLSGTAQLNADRAIVAAGGKLSPEHQAMLNNTEELQKYLANNALTRTAELNKAGLGAKTSVRELEMVQAAIARGDMQAVPILRVLLNQRKGVQNAIPKFNQRQMDVHNSPDLDPIQRTLASHPLAEIPDHPLAKHLENPDTPTTKKYPTPSPAAVQLLRSGRISKETFEDPEHYGPGAAARAMSGK